MRITLVAALAGALSACAGLASGERGTPLSPETWTPRSQPQPAPTVAQAGRQVQEAGLLINESTPLFNEVAGAFERGLPTDWEGRHALFEKAQKADRSLAQALGLLEQAAQALPDRQELIPRLRKVRDLLDHTRGWVKRLKPAG